MLSQPPVASQWLSGLIATARTTSSRTRKTTGSAEESFAVRSHSRAVLSSLPVTSQWLSGLISTALTELSWPRKITGLAEGSLVVRSQSRAVLSPYPPPVTSQWLSGLIATALTEPSWPCKITGLAEGSLAVRSQSRAVLSRSPRRPTPTPQLSPLPVTSQWLSRLIATALIGPSWTRKIIGSALALKSQSRAVPSLSDSISQGLPLPVTSQWLSGLIATALIG